MPEKKTSGIKNFFEEFKAFAMRGNVLYCPSTPLTTCAGLWATA